MILKMTKDCEKKMNVIRSFIKDMGFEIEDDQIWSKSGWFMKDKGELSVEWSLSLNLPNRSLVIE